MAQAGIPFHTGSMNPSVVPADSHVLRVLIASQSPHMGAALASLLGEPNEISYAIVGLSGVLPLDVFRAGPHGIDVVLLDLEPWPAKALRASSTTAPGGSPPLLVLALAHSVEESMRRQCREAGVDHLLDRTADLGRLQSMIADFAHVRRSAAALTRGAL